MSQKSLIAALLAVMTVVACVSMAAKDNPMGIAEKQTITFSAPTVVGGTLLPAGQYNVLHQMNGQTHVMVFKQINGKAEAQANCNLVPLKTKAERTEQRFTTNAKNERVLQEMTFTGDKATHVLAQ
jgi:lipopolysaccharide export LptBFGC system permease protein LptF